MVCRSVVTDCGVRVMVCREVVTNCGVGVMVCRGVVTDCGVGVMGVTVVFAGGTIDCGLIEVAVVTSYRI